LASKEWKVVGASVEGFSHQTERVSCQDAHAFLTTIDGWLVGAVSDGAGSALHSAQASKLLCDDIVAYIISRAASIQPTPLDEVVVRCWIEKAVEQVRDRLRHLAVDQSGSIEDFQTTLVGVVAGETGGIIFHVGDGVGLATCLDNLAISILSPPENGEYINETFFITQGDWRDHLRLTSFGNQFDLIVLMTDGVTPFAMSPGCAAPFAPFFEPLSKFLAKQPRKDGERALAATLACDAIRPITGDYKTLLWAIRVASHDNVLC
jgi:hypothetical protein